MARKTQIAPAVDLAAAVDELGRLQVQLTGLKNREAELKEALLAAGGAEIAGSLFRAKITTATRWTLNMDEARRALGKTWCDANLTISTVRSVRVTPRAEVIAAAAERLAA